MLCELWENSFFMQMYTFFFYFTFLFNSPFLHHTGMFSEVWCYLLAGTSSLARNWYVLFKYCLLMTTSVTRSQYKKQKYNLKYFLISFLFSLSTFSQMNVNTSS